MKPLYELKYKGKFIAGNPDWSGLKTSDISNRYSRHTYEMLDFWKKYYPTLFYDHFEVVFVGYITPEPKVIRIYPDLELPSAWGMNDKT